MNNKYYNDAIIGNKNITASYSNKGELLRLYNKTVDYRQYIDFFHTGVKVNESSLIYLHNDVNNIYKQYYTEKTNVLNTEIKNTYFKLEMSQIDFVPIDENILLKRYSFKNNNSIDLELKFLIHSKMVSENGDNFYGGVSENGDNFGGIVSENDDNFGSRVFENGMIQYNRYYNICTFSKKNVWKYQLKDVCNNILTGNLEENDYIGKCADSAISYDLGVLKPGETTSIDLFVYMNIGDNKNKENHIHESMNKVNELKDINFNKQLIDTKKYWVKYVEKHDTIKLKYYDDDLDSKLKDIYIRSILLFPLLINNSTGGISSAIEVDERKERSGGYSYCWTREAVFVTQALDILGMDSETEKFYKNFCKKTQNSDGMWEQKFYTSGGLVHCSGYQIDETASVVYGVYQHYKKTENAKFLKETLSMCEKAIKFLNKYVESLMGLKDEDDVVKQEIEEEYKTYDNIYNKPSFDIWETIEGVHLYSLSSIFAAYTAMIDINKICETFFKDNRVKLEELRNNTDRLERYVREVKKYILNNLCVRKTKTLRRNTHDEKVDISTIGSVVPFDVFSPNEKKVLNTVDKINMTLRTYTGGYLRFQDDGYIGGNNPWTVSTLWMGLYYKKIGDERKVRECVEFIVNSASEHGFIAEQVNNVTLKPEWVIGLAKAHAMFIMLIED